MSAAQSIKSPEVRPDGSVTFRLLAPAATKAEVQFEFAKKVGVVPMHRGARDRLTKDPEAAILLLTDEQLAQANMVDWNKVNADEWRDKWNRFVGR